MTSTADKISRTVTVGNRMGLHGRPAAQLVMMLAAFPEANLTLAREDDPDRAADCRSVLSMLVLAASKGTRLILSGEGKDINAAMDAVANYFSKNFDEE